MKRILLSFIGNNDCHLNEGKEGAILSILKQRAFNVLYILYNEDSYLPFASQIREYCKKRYPAMKVYYQEAAAYNPIDYNLVYPAMVASVKNIIKEAGTKDTEYTISLTSGTPTMHSCWVLISQSGIIKTKLIQSSREEGLQEVNFALDDFPQLTGEKQTKIELTKATRENNQLRKQQENRYSELIGEHDSILKLKQQIDNLAKYDIPVFIYGESGTGKEVVAGLLHYHSPRKEAPFIPVNCGAISENLFESEFFGHKKGSFTGAITDHEGYFSQADRGTLFLDEVCDLPLPMQVKLLRVLETGSIQPVGGKVKQVQVRIITASNKDIDKLVKEGRFREDLFYRIVQGKLELSPLRERGADILLLATCFLNRLNKSYQSHKQLGKSAEQKLLNYRYPGNVRQLQTIIKLAYISSAKDIIDATDILLQSENNPCLQVEIPPEGIDLDNEVIPAYYQAALKRTNGNASEAARLLRLKPHTFRARIKLRMVNIHTHER